jgi:hypothetical protein
MSGQKIVEGLQEAVEHAKGNATDVRETIVQVPVPTIGRIVHYKLNDTDAGAVNRRHDHANSHLAAHREAKTGVQLHVGNYVRAGEIYPMIIVRVWPQGSIEAVVNGQVLLDGNEVLWKASVLCGPDEGQFMWPERV